jgi:hypothetical protein
MNAQAHRLGGAVAGGGVAFVTRKGQNGIETLVEVLAGAGGGILGAKVPDWIEPATHSWHRGTAHSFTVAGGITAGSSQGIVSMEASCQERIATARLRLQYAATPGEQLLHTLEILFWLALVALLKGLAGGYVSHLALDALTPRGIPII